MNASVSPNAERLAERSGQTRPASNLELLLGEELELAETALAQAEMTAYMIRLCNDSISIRRTIDRIRELRFRVKEVRA
jgi:hypothetical protein